jgi:hypothetical protein
MRPKRIAGMLALLVMAFMLFTGTMAAVTYKILYEFEVRTEPHPQEASSSTLPGTFTVPQQGAELTTAAQSSSLARTRMEPGQRP